MTNLFEQDRLKASYGKSLEGKSMPKGSFQRPRLVRKGSKEAAEDGPGAARLKELPVKGQRVEAATEAPVSASGCLRQPVRGIL